MASDVAAAIAVLCLVLTEGVPWDEAKRIAANNSPSETVAAIKDTNSYLTVDGGYWSYACVFKTRMTKST
jgi:hypothetical protein